MKRFLFIAFHFPPISGSSGHLRAVKACKHLTGLGWTPTVLTVKPWTHERTEDSQLKEIPGEVCVIRCFALDARRHLSIRGRHLLLMSLPDRWSTWLFSAILSGWRAIRRDNAAVILSTFPIASAVLIGWILHRLTGRPWVVDIRDPLTKEGASAKRSVRAVMGWIESLMVRDTSRLIFTTHAAREIYLRRYPNLSPERCAVVANGYDEEDFAGLSLVPVGPAGHSRPLRLIHLGLLYQVDRDPCPFLKAVARLKREGAFSALTLQIDLRAPEFEDYYSQIVRDVDLADIVNILPPLPYREALQDAATADALLLFQAASCDQQVPAKSYEYLRLGRPILGLLGRNGDTARLLRETGGATIFELSDEEEIYKGLPAFLDALRSGKHLLPDAAQVLRYSRKSLAASFAQALEAAAQTSALTSERIPRP